MYYQCDLKECEGIRQLTTWIEERGAIKGAHIEIKDFGNALFRVENVYSKTSLTGEQLAEQQRLNRNSLPSITIR